MKVDEAMVAEVITCTPEESLQSVGLAMWENNCGCIPVVDDEHRPVGIITDRDIAMCTVLRHQPLWEIQARDLANNRPVYTCAVDNTLETAQQQMRTHEVRRLPVVDQNGVLVGIIALGDIVAQTDPSEKSGLSFEETLTMLKSVSAHHRPQNHELLSM